MEGILVQPEWKCHNVTTDKPGNESGERFLKDRIC